MKEDTPTVFLLIFVALLGVQCVSFVQLKSKHRELNAEIKELEEVEADLKYNYMIYGYLACEIGDNLTDLDNVIIDIYGVAPKPYDWTFELVDEVYSHLDRLERRQGVSEEIK